VIPLHRVEQAKVSTKTDLLPASLVRVVSVRSPQSELLLQTSYMRTARQPLEPVPV